MSYIAIGVLIGFGIMLAPVLIELVAFVVRIIPLVLFSAFVLAAVAAGIYGLFWVVAENANQLGFWILIALSSLAAFVLFWPRSKSDGVALVRARGLIAGSLILLVIGCCVLIGAALLAAIIIQNWRDPAFWLGSVVVSSIAAFVLVSVRRSRREEEEQRGSILVSAKNNNLEDG